MRLNFCALKKPSKKTLVACKILLSPSISRRPTILSIRLKAIMSKSLSLHTKVKSKKRISNILTVTIMLTSSLSLMLILAAKSTPPFLNMDVSCMMLWQLILPPACRVALQILNGVIHQNLPFVKWSMTYLVSLKLTILHKRLPLPYLPVFFLPPNAFRIIVQNQPPWRLPQNSWKPAPTSS